LVPVNIENQYVGYNVRKCNDDDLHVTVYIRGIRFRRIVLFVAKFNRTTKQNKQTDFPLIASSAEYHTAMWEAEGHGSTPA
jgi:hypothetical protein